MARRRYQKGSIRKRGKRNPVWQLQWWADYINPDGSLGRRRESTILGYASELTRRQAHKLAGEHLRPLNMGKVTPLSNLKLGEFVERHFIPNVLPTLKLSTRRRYHGTLNVHLLPAFGDTRLCDIGTLDLQRFVLQKMEHGLGWESCSHLRNLMSKIFATAKKWNFFPGDNPDYTAHHGKARRARILRRYNTVLYCTPRNCAPRILLQPRPVSELSGVASGFVPGLSKNCSFGPRIIQPVGCAGMRTSLRCRHG